MSGWGRVPVWTVLGVALAFGCGGRTSALEGDYGFSESGSGNVGGSVSTGAVGPTAGRSGHAGTGTAQGGSYAIGGGPIGTAGNYAGGGYPTAGRPSYGGTGVTVGGAYPIGGYGVGGTAVAGGYPIGGYGAGGYGIAGYPYTGGFSTGGFASAGAPPVDCRSCLTQSCGSELGQCFQDFGCLAIFGCMVSRGCEAFQCYNDMQCKGVIDQWGGPKGQAMGELLQTFNCAFQAGCQCN